MFCLDWMAVGAGRTENCTELTTVHLESQGSSSDRQAMKTLTFVSCGNEMIWNCCQGSNGNIETRSILMNLYSNHLHYL